MSNLKAQYEQMCEKLLRERYPAHGMLPDGKEAEELREAISLFLALLEQLVELRDLEDVLDPFRRKVDEEIDCRDSLVYVEDQAKQKKARSKMRDTIDRLSRNLKKLLKKTRGVRALFDAATQLCQAMPSDGNDDDMIFDLEQALLGMHKSWRHK